jgi:hypothetical protein
VSDPAQQLAGAIDAYLAIARRPQHEVWPPELEEELLRLDCVIGVQRQQLNLILEPLTLVHLPYERLPGGGMVIVAHQRGIYAYTSPAWETTLLILRERALASRGENGTPDPPPTTEEDRYIFDVLLATPPGDLLTIPAIIAAARATNAISLSDCTLRKKTMVRLPN